MVEDVVVRRFLELEVGLDYDNNGCITSQEVEAVLETYLEGGSHQKPLRIIIPGVEEATYVWVTIPFSEITKKSRGKFITATTNSGIVICCTTIRERGDDNYITIITYPPTRQAQQPPAEQ